LYLCGDSEMVASMASRDGWLMGMPEWWCTRWWQRSQMGSAGSSLVRLWSA
jgi:hypothetical protein